MLCPIMDAKKNENENEKNKKWTLFTDVAVIQTKKGLWDIFQATDLHF